MTGRIFSLPDAIYMDHLLYTCVNEACDVCGLALLASIATVDFDTDASGSVVCSICNNPLSRMGTSEEACA